MSSAEIRDLTISTLTARALELTEKYPHISFVVGVHGFSVDIDFKRRVDGKTARIGMIADGDIGKRTASVVASVEAFIAQHSEAFDDVRQ